MASNTKFIAWFDRLCKGAPSYHYDMKYYSTCTWDESYDSSNNLICSNFQVSFRRESTDYGYFSHCGSENCKYDSGSACFTNHFLKVATSLSSSPGYKQIGSWDYNCAHASASLGTYSIPGSITIAPGGSRTLDAAVGGACTTYVQEFTITNNRSRPQPTRPTVSAYASCSTASYTSASFSAGVSWGYCENGYNSSSYTVTDDKGNVVRSGSGTSVTIGNLQANTKYNVTFNVSNGCYSASASASTVTATGNNLTDLSPKTWDSASVRIVPIMGGGYYNSPTHTVQISECGRNNWRNVATSSSTTPVIVDITGLQAETCYQVRCTTSNGSVCNYTSNVQTFTTPKKGICLAEFTSIDPDTNSRCSETWADVCYKYETLLTPADITVYYRVKDGYDPTWITADTRTINNLTGTACFRINELFPNQVVYEAYIHTHTAEVDWDSEKTEFITPVCPEATSDNCESLTYMTEYLCASIKKIIEGGNMTVFANPYSLQLCEPGNEAPTSLTLWSRYLRLAHAYLCILCDFMNLSHVGAGQYLVGEIGWTNILTEIVESQMATDGWKLATSDAIYNYIHTKLKQVWHYQGTVDVIVATVANLASYPNATSAIVTGENAIYNKVNGNWTKNTELVPEDFGVWHINDDSDLAKAESGWYYWGGTWNNLDADLSDLEEQIEALEGESLNLVEVPEGSPQRIAVVDKSFDFSTADLSQDTIYFVTEPTTLPTPIYYTVTFAESDGTVIGEQQVLSGGIVGLPTPTREGYNFTGWTKDGAAFEDTMPILSDITLYANWQPQQVSVTYSIGAAEGATPDAVYGDYGMTVTLPNSDNFSYEGKTFGGWEWNGVKWNDYLPVWDNIVLNAIWDSVMITVAISVGSGVPDQILQVEYGTTIDPPATPTRDGYDFVGWADSEGNIFDFSQPITQNTTIVAQWTPANVTVSFNTQTLPPDATDTVENVNDVIIPRGSTVTEPVVTAENYILVYWTLNGTRFNFDTPVMEDITLDAVWVEAFDVEFDADGGTPAPVAQKVPNGGFATKPEDPSKEGCEFEGWMEE